MDALQYELRTLAHEALSGWDTPLDGRHLGAPGDAPTVHFGYRDAIARVALVGIGGHGVPHAAGEVLLGHDNDAGFDRWQGSGAFFRNGSFGVLRKMQQDERRFRQCVQAWADALDCSREYVMAKLCGRWPSGEPVQPGETAAPRTAADGAHAPQALIDDFDFSADQQGHGCPFGAHIRRMNPRSDPVVPFRRRPLIRRGLPYGPPYDGSRPDDVERGLLGLFFCASIEDQFEHLLAEWAEGHPLGTPVRGRAKDPLIGNHEDARDEFDIPMADGSRRRLGGFAPYVVTRGTLYAFYPSRDGLAKLAFGFGSE